jgi:hypothetical protein
LVVAVDELVLELTNLVDEDTELVGDVGDIIVATLAPDGKLLLKARKWSDEILRRLDALPDGTHSNLHALTADKLH